MSRIDEALKRASQGPRGGLVPARSGESPVRVTEDYTPSDYPLESRSTPTRVDRSEVPFEYPAPALPRPEPRGPAPVVSRTVTPNEKLALGTAQNPVSSEQYRRLAATLHEVQLEKGLKVLMITSAAPREGKTLTAINVALTLSESYGRTVLLIDADLRCPAVHSVLGIPGNRGLADLLHSNHSDVPVVQVTPRLAVLPSGKTESDPLQGLSSPRMGELIDDFASRLDWVIIDTPPVGVMPDAKVLSRLAQAAIFVIRAQATSFEIVDGAIEALGRDRIIGVVLNGVEEKAIHATSYYGGYYNPEK